MKAIPAMALVTAIVFLAACGENERMTPVKSATAVRVLVDRNTKLGARLAQQYGDAPVPWCSNHPATWCSAKLHVEIRDPERISALIAFTNDLLEGWGTPWYGAPVPKVEAHFYDGDKPAGTLCAGKNFFARGPATLLSRKASRSEIMRFLELVEVEPSQLERFRKTEGGEPVGPQ